MHLKIRIRISFLFVRTFYTKKQRKKHSVSVFKSENVGGAFNSINEEQNTSLYPIILHIRSNKIHYVFALLHNLYVPV